MMIDERDAYIAHYHKVRTMPLPEGWQRLDSLPVSKVVRLLQEDGHEYVSRPSNVVFLTSAALHIAWQEAA